MFRTRTSTRSIGEMRMEQAEYARDGKREGATCAKGLCTAPAQRDAPEGYTGPYGGHRVCPSCYEELVDYLAKHGHLPNLARSTTSPQSCEAEGRTDEDHSEGWCDTTSQ